MATIVANTTCTTNVTSQDDSSADAGEPTVLPLSPYDIACLGRAIPMVWIYSSTLDVEKLVSSLEATLGRYPVLCGRYDKTPPTGVAMNNKGVVLERATCPGVVSEYLSHLNPSTDPTFFDTTKHVPLLPKKSGMDPDIGDPEAPLAKVKVTTFEGEGGGTAIGVLMQHGVVDAEAAVMFMKSWSRAFSGQPDPPPDHVRLRPEWQAAQEPEPSPLSRPEGFLMNSFPPGPPPPPEFAGVMPKIMGTRAVLVPFGKVRMARKRQR